MPNPSRSWLPAYIATGITSGCSFLFIKHSLGFLSPFGVDFVRCGLGVVSSGFAFMWNFRVLAARASSIASTVTYLSPVVAVIVGVIFLHESPTWYEPIGGVIVLLGAAIAQGRFRHRTQTLRS